VPSDTTRRGRQEQQLSKTNRGAAELLPTTRGKFLIFAVCYDFIRSRTTTVPGMIYYFSSITRNAPKSEVARLA
jgi:hypothetical protein